MAITRIAKGTASSKTSDDSLELSSVSCTAGDLLIVGVAYETGNTITSVKWGGKEMKLMVGSGATQGDTRVRLYRKRIHKTAEKDITVKWGGAMSARAMFASVIKEATVKDVGQTNTPTATGSPGTGTAPTSTIADTISIAAFASLGPISDGQGTAGVGHTLGQRAGTLGAPPVSNVTIQETYEILSATGNIRAVLTGATPRDWACTIVALAPSQTYTILSCYQAHRSQNQNPDWVYFAIADESGRGFTVGMHPDDFVEATDDEVYEELKRYCSVHAENIIDGDWDPQPSSVMNIKMATFVDDEIIL